MGVKDFHIHTRHYITPVHISKYRGCRVGCDASGWLFRGLTPYAYEVLTNQSPWAGREDPPWVSYAMRMVYQLKDAGVEPVLIFDGCRNPAKAPTSVIRSTRRRAAKDRFAAAQAAGDVDAARKAAAAAAEVTPSMAHDLQCRLRAAGFQFMVAPYEADSQLAYLAALPRSRGGIAAVLTEDSDLVAFGCTVSLFKFGVKTEGSVDELTLPMMLETKGEDAAAAGGAAVPKNLLCFAGWDQEMLLAMCILAGCDFLPSLTGMGIKTAYKLVAEGRSLEGTLALLGAHKRWKGALTEEYAASARRARESFLYAAVYDPVAGAPARLAALPPALAAAAPEDTRHVGPDLDPALAHAIAHGHVNPHTLQPFNERVPPPPLEWRWTVREEAVAGIGGWLTAGTAQRQLPAPQAQPQEHNTPTPPQQQLPAAPQQQKAVRMDGFELMYGCVGAPRQAPGPAAAAPAPAAPAPAAAPAPRLLQPSYDAHHVRTAGNPFARTSPPGPGRTAAAAAEAPPAFKPPSVSVSLSGAAKPPYSGANPQAAPVNHGRWAEFAAQGPMEEGFRSGAAAGDFGVAAPAGGAEQLEVTSPLRNPCPGSQAQQQRDGAWAPRPAAAATLARRGGDAPLTASNGSGGKRKVDGGGQKKPGKKAAAMAAAAAGSLRISSFFRPAGPR